MEKQKKSKKTSAKVIEENIKSLAAKIAVEDEDSEEINGEKLLLLQRKR